MNGADWSKRYPLIIRDAARIKGSAILDAEAVWLDATAWLTLKRCTVGRTTLGPLPLIVLERRHRRKRKRKAKQSGPTERSSPLTAYHVPAATAGRTAASPVPTWRGPPQSAPGTVFILQKEKWSLNSPRPFGVRIVRRNPMDWMLIVVVVLLLLSSLVSAHGSDIGGRRRGS